MEKKNFNAKNIIRYVISGGLLIFAAVILFRQYVYIPDEYEAPPVVTPAPATPTPELEPTPTPYVKKIPVKMYFTDREVSCDVQSVGPVPYTDSDGNALLNENGQIRYTMGTVDSEKIAGWLEQCVSPGEYGNSIFNGHVSWKKVAGTFSILPKMEVGEGIVLEMDDGSIREFEVTSVEIYNINDVPADVMAYDTGDARITLITCYGESWNSHMGTRDERCVLVAKPVMEY